MTTVCDINLDIILKFDPKGLKLSSTYDNIGITGVLFIKCLLY